MDLSELMASWVTYYVLGQLGLHSETLSQKQCFCCSQQETVNVLYGAQEMVPTLSSFGTKYFSEQLPHLMKPLDYLPPLLSRAKGSYNKTLPENTHFS